MANSVLVQNTKFQVDMGSGTFSDVANVTSISGLGSGSSAEIDITTFDSSGKEFRQGLKDEGSLTIDLIYDPGDTQHSKLESLRDNQSNNAFKISTSEATPTEFTFDAFVQTFDKSFESDEVLRASVGLRISGAVTKS